MYSNNSIDFFAAGIGALFIYLIIVCGIFALFAFYYKSIIDTMSLVRPSNRETGVSNILLNIIPLFNIVYGFIVYPRICDSVKKEYQELGLPADGNFGKGLAITLQALTVASIIPFINFITLLASLIIWIVFWVKIDGYKKELEKYNGRGFDDSRVAISASADVLD